MKKNKKALIAAVIGFFVTIALYSYPYILRSQIEKRISGIEFQDASLGFSGVTLSGVKVNKEWIQGELDTVTSDFEGDNISIEGGSLNINLNNRTKNNELSSKKRTIKFSTLELKITYEKYLLNLKNSHSDGDNICFVKASLDNPSIKAVNGCIEKNSKIATIEEVSLDNLEFKGIQLNNLNGKNIKLDINTKIAEIESIKTQLTFEKQIFPVEAKKIQIFKSKEIIHLDSAKILHPWIASDWTVIKNVEVYHTDKWNFSIGSSHIQIEPEALMFSGSEDCSTWIESLPENLKTSPLDEIKFKGKMNFSVGLRPKPTFNLKSDCKAICNTVPNLRKKFEYTAYTPKGEIFRRESGIGSREWVPTGMLGDMPLAAITMEDPGFNSHHGFIAQAFFNSLTDNLKEHRFVRGGSTITMQLVKNLWLNRNKTLGRKLQEFFLSQAIESCYSKDEIIELYLNIIEFGPNKYGIASGAQYWFHKSPPELSPVETFWMASILPRPSKVSPPDKSSLKRIESLMKNLAKDGRIPDINTEILDTEVSNEEDSSKSLDELIDN